MLAANGSGRRAVRARAGRRLRGDAGWSSRARSSGSAAARPCTVCCSRPARDRRAAAASCIVHGGPTGQALADWNAARAVARAARAGRCCSRTTAARPGYGRAYTQALAGRWGERDVADVAAGIRHAVKEGWADPIASRADGRQRRRAHRVARRGAASRSRRTAVDRALSRSPICSTSRRRRTGSSPATTCGSSARCPDAADRYRERSPITRAGEIRAPVLLLHGDDDTIGAARAVGSGRRRAARRGTTVERHVYEGEGHGWRRAATIADELERIDAFLDACDAAAIALTRSNPTVSRARSAARIARCCSRTARAPTCTPRRSRPSPTRSPTRRSRRCGSTSRTWPRAGAVPTGRRCSPRPCAKPRPSCRAARKVPLDRLVLGGRSMGGRICSLVAADADDPLPALGLVLLGYPLHPPGQAGDAARRALPAHSTMPVPVRERHARRVRDARRAEAPRQEDQGPGRRGTGSRPATTGSSR